MKTIESSLANEVLHRHCEVGTPRLVVNDGGVATQRRFGSPRRRGARIGRVAGRTQARGTYTN